MRSETGNRAGAVIVQNRDLHVFSDLPFMCIADSSQLQRSGRFGSVRRTNDRLHRLVLAGLLRRYFVGTIAGGKKAVYSLSARGAALVGAKAPAISYRQDQLITADQFISHQLQINEMYLVCKYGSFPEGICFKRWLTFSKPLSETIRLIPDGYCELQTPQGSRYFFLEVDLGTESLKIWQQKVQSYLQLAISGEFAKLSGQSRFSVLVLAHSERRLNGIRRIVAASTDKIFWFAAINRDCQQLFSHPVWLRPHGDQHQSIFH